MMRNKADYVRTKRERMGLTQRAFAALLSMGASGERTVRGWESGEHIPSDEYMKQMDELDEKIPFKFRRTTGAFTFIDLFAGIGGIRLPFQELGGKCVFTSEWDKFAQKTYTANFAELPEGDITAIAASEIPHHDVLLAGFPCQAFSGAGLRRGFLDTRGTMFFQIQRILAYHRPKAFLLENVKQLKSHDNGRTLKTILAILRGDYDGTIPDDIPLSDELRKSLETKLDYSVDYRVLTATDFGVPQKRERIYIVGFDRSICGELDITRMFDNLKKCAKKTLGQILEDNSSVSPKYTISDRLLAGHERRRKEQKEKGNGFGYSLFGRNSLYCNTLSARYYKDGSEILIDQRDIGKNPRKLTPRECARIQGFPEEFRLNAVSDVQLYRQFGNSVSVPVIRAIAEGMAGILLGKENNIGKKVQKEVRKAKVG